MKRDVGCYGEGRRHQAPQEEHGEETALDLSEHVTWQVIKHRQTWTNKPKVCTIMPGERGGEERQRETERVSYLVL